MATPLEEWDPLKQDAADEAAAVAGFPATGAGATSGGTLATSNGSASPQRGRKRPRTPTSSTSMPVGMQRTFATPPSGQWGAADAGEEDGSADNFSLSVKRPRIAARGKCQVWRE